MFGENTAAFVHDRPADSGNCGHRLPAPARGFLFQRHAEFAADATEFLG
jgi:hypothetical protein